MLAVRQPGAAGDRLARMKAKHKVGDVLFFNVDGVAGEGTYIGNLKGDSEVVVLIVGKHAIEFDACRLQRQ